MDNVACYFYYDILADNIHTRSVDGNIRVYDLRMGSLTVDLISRGYSEL